MALYGQVLAIVGIWFIVPLIVGSGLLCACHRWLGRFRIHYNLEQWTSRKSVILLMVWFGSWTVYLISVGFVDLLGEINGWAGAAYRSSWMWMPLTLVPLIALIGKRLAYGALVAIAIALYTVLFIEFISMGIHRTVYAQLAYPPSKGALNVSFIRGGLALILFAIALISILADRVDLLIKKRSR